MAQEFLQRPIDPLVNPRHSAHCRACKERVRDLLTQLYGECRVNHTLRWSAQPPDYANTSVGSALERIHLALGQLRGHRDFIKSAHMPPCDYFIVNPPMIVEFDESQHFSRPRLITLANYPENFPVGFTLSRWQELCRRVDARDDHPFDRDERRAWYDTLRDLLPIVHGFEPTVRLAAEEFAWCGLEAGSPHALATFRALLQSRLPMPQS